MHRGALTSIDPIIASEFEAPCYCSKRCPGILSTSSTGKYAV